MTTYSRDKLIAELERDEGIRGDLYDDATGKAITKGSVVIGNPTIGIGHCCSTNPLSQPEIEYIFQNDLAEVETDLTVNLPWWRTLDDVRQRALINLCFNLGINGLLGFKNTLKAIKDGNWPLAAIGLRGSLADHQEPARIERIAKMMETGNDD